MKWERDSSGVSLNLNLRVQCMKWVSDSPV